MSGAVGIVKVEACDPRGPDAASVIERLSGALVTLTGDGGTSSFDPTDVLVPRALFVIARVGQGAVIGCGAYRPLEGDVAEIKRMYAEQGCGGAILAHLEAAALADGYRAASLSTRRVNARAVSFYERHGYSEIAPYGRYADRPQSICLGKMLRP
ncbi:GNAT family N-acetyltransferase [Novosphingobium sp. KA1]|uniref:GNAT family N-acetyltransferase n=1 Tax=Novosphingobium sp. (strain KA1) TaxID=164608 RepID=UPI001A8EA2EE|nr:GNAT family N-acetyltransferase [Novosphingobium sp. KA1]